MWISPPTCWEPGPLPAKSPIRKPISRLPITTPTTPSSTVSPCLDPRATQWRLPIGKRAAIWYQAGRERGGFAAPVEGADSGAGVFKGQIDDGCCVKGQHLGDQEAADDGDAQGLAQFGAGAKAQGQRDGAAKGGQGGHHYGPESDDAGFVNGLFGREFFLALGDEGEIDHHDGVLLDNSHEQN